MTALADQTKPIAADQLELLVSGNRVVFAMGDAEAKMDYHTNGTLHVSLPGGEERHGTWSIGPGDAYTALWGDADGPSGTKFVRDADGLAAQDAESSAPRGRVLAILPGQAGVDG